MGGGEERLRGRGNAYKDSQAEGAWSEGETEVRKIYFHLQAIDPQKGVPVDEKKTEIKINDTVYLNQEL